MCAWTAIAFVWFGNTVYGRMRCRAHVGSPEFDRMRAEEDILLLTLPPPLALALALTIALALALDDYVVPAKDAPGPVHRGHFETC